MQINDIIFISYAAYYMLDLQFIGLLEAQLILVGGHNSNMPARIHPADHHALLLNAAKNLLHPFPPSVTLSVSPVSEKCSISLTMDV